jgi:hypothetical protein
MMTFSGNEFSIDLDSYISEGGQQRVGRNFQRMDNEWHQLELTTLGVMSVIFAGIKKEQKDNGRLLFMGMIEMFSSMSEAYSSSLGSLQSSPPDMRDLFKKSQEIDGYGKAVAETVDEFLGAMMVHILQHLSKEWANYFGLCKEIFASLSKELDERDTIYMGKILAEQQDEYTKNFVAYAEDLFQEGSVGYDRAYQWFQAAEGIYYSTRAGGFDSLQSLGQVLKMVGFPKVKAVE